MAYFRRIQIFYLVGCGGLAHPDPNRKGGPGLENNSFSMPCGRQQLVFYSFSSFSLICFPFLCAYLTRQYTHCSCALVHRSYWRPIINHGRFGYEISCPILFAFTYLFIRMLVKLKQLPGISGTWRYLIYE